MRTERYDVLPSEPDDKGPQRCLPAIVLILCSAMPPVEAQSGQKVAW